MYVQYIYTRWDSFCPTSQKIALIRSLTTRAKRICTKEHLDSEVSKLTSIFTRNGYPPPIIDRVIRATLDPKPKVLLASLKQTFLRLPWLGSASLAAQHKVALLTRKAAPWCKVVSCFTSHKVFSTCKKDVLPTDYMSNAVYLFSCVCNHSYVGRTSLRLQERMKQHIPLDDINCVVGVPNVQVRRGRGRLPKNPAVPTRSTTELNSSVSSRTQS